MYIPFLGLYNNYLIYFTIALFSKFFSLTYYRMFCVLFGPYFSNLIWYLITVVILVIFKDTHKNTYCVSLNVVRKLYVPWMNKFQIEDVWKLFLDIVFPHITLGRWFIYLLRQIGFSHDCI